jgi:hypothetical protein
MSFPAFMVNYLFFARIDIRLSKNFVIVVSMENLINKTGMWQTRDRIFLRKTAVKWDKAKIADKNKDLKQKKNF